MKLKQRIFQIIDKARPDDRLSKLFDIFIVTLIVLNIGAVILSSFKGLSDGVVNGLGVFEVFSVVIFSMEYVLRLWTSDLLYPGVKFPKIKYAVSFMAIIDLLAILPFYLPLIIHADLRFVRMLRLFRLLRIFKLNRYNDAIEIVSRVIRREKEKLVTTMLFTGIIILFASSVMYYVENEAQPDKFPNIVASIWWAVATLTTVGYGDIYPVTVLGKLLSGLIAIMGIGLVALPTGIISSGFIMEVSNGKTKKTTVCPHCGKEIDQ